MIRWRELGHETIFTHFDPETGEQRIYAVDRLLAHLAVYQPYLVPVDPDMARWMVEHRGLEAHRLARLTPEIVAEAPPVIFCKQADGTWLLVDGTHRYLWLAEHGVKWVLGYMAEPSDWEPFIVEPNPELTETALRVMDSGL